MLAQTTRGQLGAPSFPVLCERGKPSHVARTLLSARSHSRRCRRERPRSCSPYHCHPGGSGVLRSRRTPDRKSTRLNSSHLVISYAVFCLKKKKEKHNYVIHSYTIE